MIVHPTSIDLFTHGWQLTQTFSAGYGHVSIMTLQGYSFRVVSENRMSRRFLFTCLSGRSHRHATLCMGFMLSG